MRLMISRTPCYDARCWLAMMGFQLIDDHLATTVPALAKPADRPVRLYWNGHYSIFLAPILGQV
jgi:hypothetical protein